MLILITNGELSDEPQKAIVAEITDDERHQAAEIRYLAEVFALNTRTPIDSVVVNSVGAPIADVPLLFPAVKTNPETLKKQIEGRLLRSNDEQSYSDVARDGRFE